LGCIDVEVILVYVLDVVYILEVVVSDVYLYATLLVHFLVLQVLFQLLILEVF
jgi:hypothetical protein